MSINIIVARRRLGVHLSAALPRNDKKMQPTRYGRRPWRRPRTLQQRLADFAARHRPATPLQQAVRRLRRRRRGIVLNAYPIG